MNTPDPIARADWRDRPAAQWAAVLLGAMPMYALAIISGFSAQPEAGPLLPDATTTLLTTLAEVLLFGGMMTACLLFLNGQLLTALNLRESPWLMDLGRGLALFVQLFASVIVLGLIVRALGGETIPPSNIELGKQLAQDPVLAAIFAGPVIWLKAALLEEFSRVFMLSRLWRAHPDNQPRWLVLIGVSLVFGFGHIWQGWYGVLGTTLIGLVLGWHYMKYGRVLPLILAHGIYNTLVTLILIAVGSGGIPVSGA